MRDCLQHSRLGSNGVLQCLFRRKHVILGEIPFQDLVRRKLTAKLYLRLLLNLLDRKLW